MGRKAREVMEAARRSLEAKRWRHGSFQGTKNCAECGGPTTKSVAWPDDNNRMQERPACGLGCAIRIAGEENFDRARWG